MMRKNKILGVFFAVAMGAFLIAPVVLNAAEKPNIKQPAVSEGSEVAQLPDGQNVEKLLYTLNETLSENRKIRQSMRDLQEAFEKVTIEKSDLATQMRKVQQLAIQKNAETGQRIDDLNARLQTSKQEMEKLQEENKASIEQKEAVEKTLEDIRTENTKLQELLKTSILEPERDQILERMRRNDTAVEAAVTQVAAMDGENLALKEQLIQSYFDLGNTFYDLGRFQDAAVQYLSVLEWDPNHAWAHHNLAIIYDYHLHQVRPAVLHYQKYLHLKLASDDAKEVRMRLWDLEQLSNLEPDQPLRQDFKKFRKISTLTS